MDLRDYEQHKVAIADLLRSAAEIGSSQNHEWQDRLRDLFARLAEDRFNLVVVGRFSRGKTSLMNAILGTDRLPTGIVPLTSVITTVAYGSSERVVLKYDERILTREVPLEELARYVTQQGNPGNAQGIKMAEVQLPAEFLRRGFYFVDTPGLGSGIAENTRTTEAFLPEADAFLLVTSYEGPLSEEEDRFFRTASSFPRRIFVVLNKQDLVSAEERQHAIAHVRDRLHGVFGQLTPPVFSVSAREGLHAKQSGDSSRLTATGLPALEENLVQFLLTEKSTEFLASMCDRVHDLVRELPETTSTADLAEKIDELSRQIAKSRQHLAVAAPPSVGSTPIFAGLQQLSACEICRHIIQAQFDFLCRYQHDLSTSREEQRRFSERGGFCSFHTWQYHSVASPRGTCTAYSALLERLAGDLRDAASTGNGPRVFAEKTGSLLPTQDSCLLCGVRARTEVEAISKLTTWLGKNPDTNLNSLSAICLPHFAKLSAAIEDSNLARRLIERQAALFRRVSEDMERYALKFDAVRRMLASDEEENAAERALLLIAGDRNVNNGNLCEPLEREAETPGKEMARAQAP
jgi:GTP-binding protein EngB required for normal cell division